MLAKLTFPVPLKKPKYLYFTILIALLVFYVFIVMQILTFTVELGLRNVTASYAVF